MELSWSTERRKVIDLVPFEHNPRKLSEDKKQKLVESIEKFNLVEIPVINADGMLIAGHQRIKVLIILGRGEEDIDVRVPNRLLTEAELKEYNIRSNIQVGEWDVDILQEIFSDIDLLGLGLDVKSLPDFNAESLTTDEQEQEFDDTPPLEPITVLGDVYELLSEHKGITHRIICGDSKCSDTVATLMDGRLAEMVFTDPPYNVKINDIVNFGKTQHKEFCEASGEMTPEEFIQFLTECFTNLRLFSRSGSIHFICMDWKHIFEIISAGRAVFDRFMNLAVWNKDNAGMGTFYRSKHELVFIFKNGTDKHINNFELGQYGRYRTNVWDYPGANSLRGRDEILEDHPTPKPVEMVADAILDCSTKGSIVLDLFSGSGTTIIASEKTFRRAYVQEFEPAYCDVSVRRWVKYMRDNILKYKVIRNGRELADAEIDTYFDGAKKI